MKPIILFDSSLFGIPNCARNAEELEKIINCILDWSFRAANQNAFVFAVDDELQEILHMENIFPFTINLQALLDMFELSGVYSAKDISRSFLLLLERSSPASEAFGLSLSLDSVLLSKPLYDGIDIAPSMLSSSMRQWATAAILRCELEDFQNMVFVVPGLRPEDNIDVQCEVVSGTIFSGDVSTGRKDSTVQWIVSPDDVFMHLDPQALWGYADSASEYHFAISVAAIGYSARPCTKVPVDEIVEFSIGETFVSSLVGAQASAFQAKASVCLTRCALVAVGHPPAVGKDFNDIRDVDGAQSKRTHITSRHEALRLMYWRRPDGRIEFANVGNKFALSIDHGDPKHAAASVF